MAASDASFEKRMAASDARFEERMAKFEERIARRDATFEKHITKLTEQQGALGSIVEGLRQRRLTAVGPNDPPD